MIRQVAICLLLAASMTSCTSVQKYLENHLDANMAVRTTAYTHSERDHVRYGRKSAIGSTLRSNREYNSAASDWSFLPVGTKFKIDGDDTLYVIDDYGSALVGTQTIDIYRPSKAAMRRWGAKRVDIRIVSIGDYRQSLEVLRPRTGHSHVSRMVRELQNNL
jgi:3D (Asp-Asp-Asp) domain-containing protein